ncbi:MAG TPA: DNA polymerase I [Paludibacteraceae bacterium]|nr:DNA polymerase I [Paludibacteraceae bacterium]
MKRLFLLDAYALIYRAYYAFLRMPRTNSKGLNTGAIFGFVNTLEDVLKREKPTHIAVVFDPSGPTFRHEAFAAYKAQREATPEDIRKAIPVIKKIVEAYRIPVIQVAGFEADDVIGTLAQKAEKQGFEVFMMTPDKDYGQLVSEHIFIYKPKFGVSGFDTLGVPEVLEKWGLDHVDQVIDLLGLMGDASDNIPGCPGVGEKTAVKLLKEFGSIDNLLKNSDQLKGALKIKVEENREQIEFSRFLATIKTDVPVELVESHLIMEEPNKEELIELFSELEFRNYLTKLLGNEPTVKVAKTPKVDLLQGSLFDDVDSLPASLTTTEIARENIINTMDFASVATVKHVYKLVQTDAEIEELVKILSKVPSFCFDTETTSVEVLEAELVGLSFAAEAHKAYYVPVPENRDEANQLLAKFKPVFENEQISKIAQNAKFDLMMLENYGIVVKGQLFDTMIAHYLLNPELRHGMDYLAEILLNYRTIHIEDLLGPRGKNQLNMRQVSLEKVAEYAAEDADITWQLKTILEQQILENHLEELFYEIEMPLVRVLAQMERNGMLIDDFALTQSSQVLTSTMQKIERSIQKIAGDEVNVSSPKQIGELLFDRLKVIDKPKKTKTGQYVTDEETLQFLRGKHPIIDQILEYRGLKKLLSTYIDALPKLINNQTGKVHTSFNQTVTATGRLSSSNPNLQNIPIRDEQGKEIRKAFIAEPGCLFVSADYSQVELRIMAHLSNDTNMVNAFLSDQDIHAATAANIYHLPLEAVTSDMRRKAKTANFGIIYGISVFGLSERLAIPRSEAKELIDGYFVSFPQVKDYMDQSIEKARENGYVETLFHRKRFLADINSHNGNVRGFAERNAINAPIQGSAADIIKIAMVRIHKRLQEEKLQTKMILQVHDELNFNVPEAELEQVKKLIKTEMEQAITLRVPLKVDIGVGQNWFEAH